MEENKEMLELLVRIEKNGRRQARLSGLLCILSLAAVVLCAAVLLTAINVMPQITQILPRIDTVLTQLNTVLGNLETMTGPLAAIDFSGMVSDVDALVVSGQQSLELTMGKLNELDIATLNKAINDLAQVVEPLSKFFQAFS